MTPGEVNLTRRIRSTRRRRRQLWWVEGVALVGMIVAFIVVGLATWWIGGA